MMAMAPKKKTKRIPSICKKIVSFLSIFVFLVFSAVHAAEDITTENKFGHSVVLRVLNKVSTRASILTVPVNTVYSFGSIDVHLAKCWKAAPEDHPETAALLQIWEKTGFEIRRSIFSGWMFSSSPALSSLEHPVYDIVVLDCKYPLTNN